MRQSISSAGSFTLSEYRYPGEILSLVITFSMIALLIVLAIRLFPGNLFSILSVLAITLAGVLVYVCWCMGAGNTCKMFANAPGTHDA